MLKGTALSIEKRASLYLEQQNSPGFIASPANEHGISAWVFS